MADSVGQQGNSLYKEGKYDEALKSYITASQLDPKEPKYPSNASAVCFELGQYQAAIAHIVSAWKCYFERNPTVSSDDAFAVKLATRFAKAKANGICDRSIDLHESPPDDMRATEAALEEFALRDRDTNDPKIRDMRTSWEQFRAARASCTGHSKEECNVPMSISAAEKRMREMPIYKAPAEPTLEYYIFSHDEPKSLLNGLSGPGSKNDPYVLDTDGAERIRDWAFLFGGSGDGRHVFTTLQHLAAMKKKRKIADLNAHITMVDVHPAALARNLMVIALLQKVLKVRDKDDEEEHLLLQTTLFYVYNWLIIPRYCLEIFSNTCQELIENLDDEASTILQLVYIDSQSLEEIMTVLRYWSKPLNDKHVSPILEDVYASSIFKKIDGLPPFPMPGVSMTSARAGPRKPIAYEDYDGEKDVFKLVPVLLPPRPLASRHPRLKELAETYTSPAVEAAAKEAKQEVLETWQLNPTIFDNSSTEHPNLSQDGYPVERPNPFGNIEGFAAAAKEYQLDKPPAFCAGTTAFGRSAHYFEVVADALRILADGLKIEMIVGDVMSGMPRLMQGDLAPRPEAFPKEYTRMWLSNVPDYTHGFLSTAIYLLPYLQPGQLAASNVLLNSMCWRSMADLTFNYTLLYPKDFPRFLGCEIIYTDRETWGSMALRPLHLPREARDLASKKELYDWLARLLLCILRNGGYRGMPVRVSMPANIGMFFHLLVHLHRVGFPAHWIGDFVQAVVSDSLVTEARPYLGQLPIPRGYAHQRHPAMKVHLAPWRANFEVIIASIKPALPFALALPEGFPDFGDICMYTAPVTADESMPWTRQFSYFTLELGIIFFKPRDGVNGYMLASHIEHIIDGTSNFEDNEVQITLSLERVNIAKGEVSWRMNSQRYERMRSEGWTMVVYRCDSRAPVTLPLAASNWHRAVI